MFESVMCVQITFVWECFSSMCSYSFSELERLVVLRIVRPDKMIFAIKSFVTKHMGEEFIHVPSFDMNKCFADSDKLKPLILVLFPGCDPLSPVYNFTPARTGKFLGISS